MLASFDIGTMMSQENQIKNVPIDMLKTYHNHKFQLYTGERLDDMVESVKENGILLPIIIQQFDTNLLLFQKYHSDHVYLYLDDFVYLFPLYFL